MRQREREREGGKRVETNVRRANYAALSPMLTTDVSSVITGSLRCASFHRRKRSVVNRATFSL